MEIAELDRRLLELTESERAYRDGARYDWSARADYAEIDGRRMLRMDDFMRARYQEGMPEGLAIVRNSRFNPVPEHVHDYVEIGYVYRGRCPQKVAGRDLTVGENEVLLLDADCPHAVVALGEGDVMLSVTLARPLLQRCLEAGLPAEGALSRFLLNALSSETDHRGHIHFHCGESRRIRRYFQEMLCERLEPAATSPAAVLRLFELILIELMDCYERELTAGAGTGAGAGPAGPEALVAGMLAYIEQRYCDCALPELADRFGLSPNYASALLKRWTGKTYLELVQERRLARAMALLRAGATVEDAAHAAGYGNMTFFYRKFRARYGVAPAACRPGRA